jgi:hypothetical protein
MLAPTVNNTPGLRRALFHQQVSVMAARKCPVLLDTSLGQTPAGVSASPAAQPVEVSLALREKGWTAYRVQFDPAASAWIAKVIDWSRAA